MTIGSWYSPMNLGELGVMEIHEAEEQWAG